ncbi:MAG TPA: SBBP repeat-containing protein [Acidobacteriota bacterium]|nr:SBBP repeat-containing protein [Acidobacteriota bacterium]
MNTKITFLCLFVFSLSGFVSSAKASSQQMQIPLLFERNLGQEDAFIQYFARGSAYKTVLGRGQAQFIFRNEDGSRSGLGISLQASQSNAVLKHVGPAKSKVNYYVGQNQSKWKTDVPAFEAAIYKEIYPGIDWLFYENDRMVEFDFVVSPGSDPSVVVMNLNGADQIAMEKEGHLRISIGTNEFKMLAPVAYQCDSYNSQKCVGRSEVNAQYRVTKNHQVEFELGRYDQNKVLVIDPKIGFGTLLGGNTFDSANDVAVDTKRNFYVVGYTEANTRIPGNGDGFVHKFSPAGTLIWTTFLVGSGGEDARSIAVNPGGICFVGGSTTSRDFPIAGAFQPDFGGSSDGYIVKLAANGTIINSSFLGGSGRDAVNEVGLGTGAKLGRGVYLIGNTDSRNFPRKNATQDNYAGGSQDAFLTIVHALNFQQLLSTFMGTNDRNEAISLVLNPVRGDLYSTVGNTEGTDLFHFKPRSSAPAPITNYSVSKMSFETAALSKTDVKLQSAPLWGLWFFNFLLYISDPDLSSAETTALPGIGLIHSICIADPPSTTCVGGGTIQFFDQDLILRKTVQFGASGAAVLVNDAAVRKDGTIYIVGDTTSNSVPQTNSFQPTRKGGWEGVVMRLVPPNLSATLSSYIGGTGHDFAGDVAVDNAGNIFISGQTSSKNFPTTPSAPKRNLGGTADGYVIKVTEQ